MGFHITSRKSRFSPLYKSLYLSLGAAALISSPAGADDTTQGQWDCRTGEDGRWVCRQVERQGRAYARPERRQSVPAYAQDEARVRVTHKLDWVPEEELTSAEKERMRENCCGTYVEPERNYPDADLEPDDASMRVNATTTESRGNVAHLEGDVQISQGYRQVRSNSADVNQETRVVDLDGAVHFREPGILLMGDHATVKVDSGEVDVDNATFVFHEEGVRGTAGKLSRTKNENLYVDDATYTTCEPANNAWQIKAASVDIDPARGIATGRHVRLEVRDIPVFYTPWIRYPFSDARTSGLLFPVLTSGNDNGIDYSQPIYLNLAPNYDATITPRFVQERGTMLEAEFRHLSSWGQTLVSGGHLWDDDGGDQSADPTRDDGKPPFAGEDRWMVNIDHRGGFGQRWNTRIDYTDVSDEEYFRDLGNATLEVNSMTHLNQEVAVGYSTRHWQFGLKGQQFETIIVDGRDQYKQLPRLDANGQYRLGNSDLALSLRQHYVMFDHTDDSTVGSSLGPFTRDTRDTVVTGDRLRADYALTWDKEWLWGFFKPSAKVKHISYNLDDPLSGETDDSPNVTVPVASLDTGLFFERDTTWLKGFIQTFEPRVYYLNSRFRDQSDMPDFDTSEHTFSYQQLFRDDRFSGGDRIGDSEQVTLGFTSRLMDPVSGRERLRGSIGQIFYLDDRRVSLRNQPEELERDSSDIAAELGANIGLGWRLQSDLLFDDDEGQIDKGSAALRYNDRDGTLFNLVYRYTRRGTEFRDIDGDGFIDELSDDIDQVDVSFTLPLSESWNLVGRWNHNFSSGQELEVFGGIEYSSCCWRASVVARRWVDRDDRLPIGAEQLDHNNGIFFQIQFRGLAGTGTRVDSILTDGIYGYQPPDY